MTTDCLRNRLRAATADDHAALDAAIGQWRIEKSPDYRAFLQASAEALAPLELALEASDVEAWLPDWSQRSRREALLSDLEALGGVAPRPVASPPMSRAFSAGLLYVLEGSRLGGRVLSRRVASGGGGLPTTYLRHGEEAGLWRSFLVWMEGVDKIALKTEDAIAGARYGFRRFADAFETVRRPRSVDA